MSLDALGGDVRIRDYDDIRVERIIFDNKANTIEDVDREISNFVNKLKI